MTSAEWAADTGSYKNTWTVCRRELSPLGRRNIQREMCVVLWMREEREVKKQAKPEKECVFVCVCVLSGLFFCCEPPHCYATHRARDSPWTGQQSVLEKTLSLSVSLSSSPLNLQQLPGAALKCCNLSLSHSRLSLPLSCRHTFSFSPIPTLPQSFHLFYNCSSYRMKQDRSLLQIQLRDAEKNRRVCCEESVSEWTQGREWRR